MTDVIQVATTTDSLEAAQSLARHLVTQRVAACVQVVGPVRSCYRWQGEIQNDEEWQCVAKTRADAFQRLDSAIREVHTYDVPEILATPVVAGSREYLEWVDQQTRPD
jgi:periplasmic divalent cation tolerance protein